MYRGWRVVGLRAVKGAVWIEATCLAALFNKIDKREKSK